MPREIEKMVAGTRLAKPGDRNSYFERGEEVPIGTFDEKRTRMMLSSGALLAQHGDQNPTVRNLRGSGAIGIPPGASPAAAPKAPATSKGKGKK